MSIGNFPTENEQRYYRSSEQSGEQMSNIYSRLTTYASICDHLISNPTDLSLSSRLPEIVIASLTCFPRHCHVPSVIAIFFQHVRS